MTAMDEYESLREDIAAVADSLSRYSQAVGHATGNHDLEIRKIWEAIACMGDDQHALANRIETLTRALTTDPAEVAQKIVNDANTATLRAVTKQPYDQDAS